MALVPKGLVKGLGVTFKELTKTIVDGAETVQYPHEKEAPAHPDAASSPCTRRTAPRAALLA
ncbi:MAG: hypothetical protein R2710_09545 [Acidimicrobiales bacterium]